jgi:hypothetical protein
MIKDGTGKGYLAQVDSKNRIRTYSVTEDESSYVNRVEKQSYSGTFSGGISAASSDNFIVYLKNTSSEKDLVITRIRHRCENDDGTISFWLRVDGTPGGSLTTLTPTNRNAGTNNTADCVYYKSNNITGLSGGRLVGSVYGKMDEKFENADPCSGYILPPASTFAIKSSNTTAIHYGGIAFYFRDSE